MGANWMVIVCAIVAAREVAGQAPASTPRDPIEGKWYGMAGFPQDRVELGIEFKRNERQELKAYLHQPVINFYGLELPGAVTRDGDLYVLKDYAISLTLHTPEHEPDDARDLQGQDRLDGTISSLRNPVSLRRASAFPKEMPVPELPRGPEPRWRAKLGAAIHATAAMRDGVVYVGTAGGMFYAVNGTDGGFVWAFAAGRPVYGEAIATEAHVYFVCDNGFLFKLDRTTGKEVWRYDVGDAQSPRVLPHQVVTNSGEFDFDDRAPRPVIVDGVIYIGAGDGSFHAVDAGSGQRIWRVTGRGKVRTTAAVDGARVIFGSFDNNVYALDRVSGAELWRRDTRGPVTSAPVLVGEKRDTLIVGNRNGLLAALDAATGSVRWRMFFWGSSVESEAVPGDGSLFYIGSSDLRRVSLIDSRDGQVLGRTDVFGWAWPRPLVTDRFVYASAAGASPYQMRHLGSLSALDRRSGAIVWRWPMSEWAGSWLNGFTASPASDGRTLVVGGLDGTLYAFPIE